MKLPQPLLAAVLLLSACAAPAAHRTFDLRAPAIAPAPTAGEDGGAGDGLLRAAEAPAAAAGALAPGDAVTLLLFDGETVDIEIVEAAASTISGSRAFLARTEGSPLMNAVVLADADGNLHVRAQGLEEGRVLRVFPRGGATAVEESEPAPVVEDGEPPAPAPVAAPAPDGGGGLPLPTASLQSDQLVDVLVAFDLGAKEFAELNGGTTNFAETAVQNMNLSLANSNLSGTFRFRLVGIEFVDDRKTAVHSALSSFGKEAWAHVPTARAETGADVVTLLVDTGIEAGITGVGYGLQSTTPVSYFSAINACAVRAVVKGETMTHEVGHNLGCGHANTKGQSDPGPQSFPYSSGYHFTGSDGKKYHTIMGYNSVDGESGLFELANVFSSPDLTFAGVHPGTAASNDNRRVLSQTWAWAQSWNAQVLPLTYDVFFTPASGTFVDGSLAVSLAPGLDGLDIRYTLDGSAPTLSSPLYTGPITLAESTTIRAATVYNGVLGPVCTARYPVYDFAEALDTPGLAWEAVDPYFSSNWGFETDVTFDGVDSARCDHPSYGSDSLQATIVGPTTMSFRWSACMHNTDAYQHTGTPLDELAVYIDGAKAWSDAAPGLRSPWKQSQVEIPAGSHTVAFRFNITGSPSSISGREYCAWVDTVRFDALSSPPVLSPATTDDEETATTFAGGPLAVSLSSPDGDGAMIFYTTDGSDPLTDGVLYEGPLAIAASTRVRAVAVANGRDASVETAGMYLERHRPVLPGEWTADLVGLTNAAAADPSARLILGFCTLSQNFSSCESFRQVAEDPAFTSWCAANGVYLLVSDLMVRPDGAAAKGYILGWMKKLHPTSTPAGPVLIALAPDGGESLADAFAMVSGVEFGSETYRGSADSLIACVAALLGGTSLSAPVVTPAEDLVAGFPVSVTLSNPNASGTIRYTLDGSAPNASSLAWSGGTLQIQRGQTLLVAVFPSGSGLTSPVLRKDYRTVPMHLGIPEGAFDWSIDSGDVPWRTFPIASVPTIRSGNLGEDAPAYKSILRATARAAGTLSFTLGDIGYGNYTVFTPPGGAPDVFCSTNYLTAKERVFTVPVEPGDILDWTRDAQNPRTENDAEGISVWGTGGTTIQTSYCGSFLSKLVWTPAGEPPELGTISVAATATGATVSVPVSALGEGSSSATVTVVVDGVEQTRTLDAPGTATFVFSGLEPGTPYTAAVTAVNSKGGMAETSIAFSTEALPSVGWFDVKWESDGYGTGTAWWNAAAERTSGGTWTIPAGDASARRGSVLELALPEGGDLRFTAVSPSAGGGFVTVDGTLSPAVTPELPDVPSGAFAALCFVRGGYKAWNGAQWISLSGAAPAASDTPWTATFDLVSSPPRVRYVVGGTTLSAAGSKWIALASAPDCVRGVGYAGGGAVGDFKATYAVGIPVPLLATLADDGVEPIVFGGTAAAPTLTITVGNAKAGLWYAVYASPTVDGDYAFVQRIHATKDGTLPFTIDATAATKFIRFKASDDEIDPADPLFPTNP
jgi:hypothetical protein